jgi:hypothetical protein
VDEIVLDWRHICKKIDGSAFAVDGASESSDRYATKPLHFHVYKTIVVTSKTEFCEIAPAWVAL